MACAINACPKQLVHLKKELDLILAFFYFEQDDDRELTGSDLEVLGVQVKILSLSLVLK